MIKIPSLILALPLEQDTNDWAGEMTYLSSTGVTYVADSRFGHMANFVNADNSRIEFGAPPSDLSEFTICSWVEITSATQMLASSFASYGATGTFQGYIFGYWTSGKLRFYVKTNSIFAYVEIPAIQVDVNVKNHWCMVYDGAKIKVYKNGIFLAETNKTGAIPNSYSITSINNYGQEMTCKQRFFYLFSKALNEGDIRRVMLNKKPLSI